METKDSSVQLLKNKYDLHKQPEVDAAARRTLAHTGEKVPQDPMVRIQNYLDRFHEITDRTDSRDREHGLDAIKRLVSSGYVTKVKDIPESYWKTQERIIRERGQQGDYDSFSEAEKLKWKNELAEGLLSDQQASLEQWVDYLVSPDSSNIPDSMKYWIFRNVINMQEYDKETQGFPERSKGTVKMFPDINEEALAYVVNAIVGKYKGEGFNFGQFDFDLPEESKQKFRQSLDGESFPKLYAWANENIQPISESELTITDGQWIKYEQDTDSTDNYRTLSQSIRGRGTGWCTAGENTAHIQLKGGDFYVYYSNDNDGNPTNPRIAIRMEGDHIAEIRGISAKQNLDPYMNDVLAAKLEEFPDKDQYLKKEADMRRLTEIDNKVKAGVMLGKDDLVFLYELNSPIEGFGNENLGVSSDPRIEELRGTRNSEQDMLTIFDCEPSQIAKSVREINEHTTAYVGKLEPGIFNQLQRYNIEHVYTSFPEGKIRFDTVTIGGKNLSQLQQELSESGINVSFYAESMMRSRDFTMSKNRHEIDLVRLKIRDMNFLDPADFDQEVYTSQLIRDPTTDQIYTRAKELGLELCLPEVGPNYRLQYKDQPMNEWLYVGMKPIAGSNGYPSVFKLERNTDGLWLYHSRWARPGNTWIPRDEVVFGLRK
ncbi:MAG: hypothetical protein M1450_01945 [Patescibacteria group bacterium]|nr:hypothetical protein [Actinomycetota bacterium]MCL5970244.1 hypothetical protein [Patescibacteria group bacterium]